MTDVLALCELFLRTDTDAANWRSLYPDEDTWESPECDVMSRRFIEFCAEYLVEARLIHVRGPEDDPWYSEHYFAVIGTTAVDWTAKQFYNVPDPPMNPDAIRCPLIFEWPGTFPLDWITLTEVETT